MAVVGLEPTRRLVFAIAPEEGGSVGAASPGSSQTNVDYGRSVVRTESGAGLYPVPLRQYRSEVVVTQDNLNGWVLSVVLHDPSTLFSLNMLTQPVFF